MTNPFHLNIFKSNNYKMKNFLKTFPFTIYSIIAVSFIFFTKENIQYDSNFIHVAALFILGFPIMVVNQIYLFFFQQKEIILWIFPIFFFLLFDLLILSIRKNLIKDFFCKNFSKKK